MAPTIVFKNDQLVGVLGSPGGSRIICYVAKTLFYIINFNYGEFLSYNSVYSST